MQLNPYLHFDGTCEAALEFYAAALRGKIVALNRYAGSPMEATVGEAYKNKIMHGSFEAGDVRFMASDGPRGEARAADSNVSLSLYTRDNAEGQRVFDALAAGGSIRMPLQNVFWGGHFGIVKDRFGISWMISTD